MGHIFSRFGGAIKNLGMGCAPPEGKRKQHNARPFSLADKCTGCGTCVEVCPESAIIIEGGKSVIRKGSCVGCFDCMHACREHAIDIDWETQKSRYLLNGWSSMRTVL